VDTLTTAIEHWHALLRPDVERTAAFVDAFADRLRAARLSFGQRVLCPFLRPLFVDDDQVARARRTSEAVARMGERFTVAAAGDPALMEVVALNDAERRLADIDPGYPMASTSSRLDAFLLPGAIACAEYNAESPAGPGYTETLVAEFDALDVMTRFRERFEARAFPLMGPLLDALLASYREWGGLAVPPIMAIVDWRDVPTWPEFEILQARFEALGVPTVLCDPRELEFDGRSLAARGHRIDLVYRRVLINDIIARPDECAALVKAVDARVVCMANTFRCKIPHKKAFFAVLTDERFAALFDDADRAAIAGCVPWTRLVREGSVRRGGRDFDLVPFVRANRTSLVLKPNDEYGGAGVTLGWDIDERAWDAAIGTALAAADEDPWVVQERIDVRREPFPRMEPGKGAAIGDMLVDSAPYLFRGRFAGFLTRLSATGLANVTSGGGQVPSFVVAPASTP
jgi:hypothetical protein